MEDEISRKKQFEAELDAEELRRGKKFSDEEREFRRHLEAERESKYMELIRKMEMEREHMQNEFELELKNKKNKHEKEMYEKERYKIE